LSAKAWANHIGRSADGLCVSKVKLQRSEVISDFGFEPIRVDGPPHASENMKSPPG
jgi:hypothetical protein